MRRAEVAGAGFAGLVAAAALARRGWQVRVHEAAEAPRSVGAGIYVYPFAQDVLRAVGAYDAVAAGAYWPATRSIHVDGACRSVTQTAGQFLTTTRAALHSAVLGAAVAAGAEVRTGSRGVAADPAGALLLAGGERLPADLVIAADGVRSAIAQQAGIGRRRTPHGDGITRVLLDREGLRDPPWDAIHDFYDYRHQPLRVLYTPCGADAFYVCLMAPVSDGRAAAVPIDAGLWARSFPMLAPVLHRVGSAGRHDRYGTTVLDRWSAGRLAVVGDAAHAMPSSLGQGAGVSMLGALRLAEAVDAAPDVPAGLAAWEAGTRPIVERWQRQAESVASQRSLVNAVHPGTDLALERPEAVPVQPAALRTQAVA